MVTRRPGMSTMNLFDARQGRKPDPRRIIGKDNLGEPIYEGEGSTGGGISILASMCNWTQSQLQESSLSL